MSGEHTPLPRLASRERALRRLGWAAGGLAAVGLVVLAVGAQASFFAVSERRLAVAILSLTGLVAGLVLVWGSRAIARHLVPLLAAAVALGLVLATLLAGDLYLGYRGLSRGSPDESIDRLHVPDARLGWLPRPNHVARHRRDGNFDVAYEIDAQSFRRMPERPGALRTLWFFGDSFTFGLGVNGEDAYPYRIARDYLNENVRVINAAVSGHGLIQMYARLLGLREQLRAGDIVVFALIAEDLQRNLNDFVFVSQFLFGPLGKDGLHYPRYVGGGVESVRVDGLAARLGGLLFHAPLTEHIHRFFYRAVSGSGQRSLREALAVLEDVRTLCEESGVGFALIFLPRAKELARGRYEVQVSDFDYADIRHFFPRDEAEVWTLRYPDDPHWTPKGHAIGAEAVVSVLVERGLLRRDELRSDPPARTGAPGEIGSALSPSGGAGTRALPGPPPLRPPRLSRRVG